MRVACYAVAVPTDGPSHVSAQVNLRVDEAALEVLEAAAFARRTSVAELVRGEILALAARLAAEPAVVTALRSREEQQAAAEGKLTSLDRKRRAPRQGPSSA